MGSNMLSALLSAASSATNASPATNRCVSRRGAGRWTSAVIGLVAWLSAAVTSAQWGGGWGGHGMGGFASTAQQGADEGIAQVVRAQGYTNLKNSEAAKNWEEAKTLEIQNRMRWTETYFEMRKTNRDSRAAEAGPPVTQEQAIRMAKMAAPPRLGSTQLDPVTGHIDYPRALMSSIYESYRTQLDKLFSDRAASGGSTQYEEYQQIQKVISQFIEALKQQVKATPAGDYGAARTFLDSLANEMRFPAG
jgi:hypothetical protein